VSNPDFWKPGLQPRQNTEINIAGDDLRGHVPRPL
jgi:hypothetical protein